MSRIAISVLGLVTGTACLLAACSWTTLTGTWRDQEYSAGPLSSVMVIVIAKEQQNQRIFEDEFAKRLRERNVNAMVSYRTFDDLDALTREEVEIEVEKLNIEAVLVTEVIGSRTEVDSYTSSSGEWHGYYKSSYGQQQRSPGSSLRIEVAMLQSKMFYIPTGKMIWSASFDTQLEGSSIKNHINSFISQCMKSLRREDLID
jgi:hypothetical protein